MKKTKFILTSFLLVFLLVLGACKDAAPAEEEETEANTITPVTITSISIELMNDVLELNATSVLLKKNYLKSPISGYITSVSVSIGDLVKKGQTVFTMQTKEANAIAGNKVIDSLLHFSGIIFVRANKEGRIDSLGHQKGDYVQEGEQVATLSEKGSLGFLLNVPYEDLKFLKVSQIFDLILPDGKIIKAKFSSTMSAADQASQTISCLLKPLNNENIAENLIVRVIIPKNVKSNAAVLPKEAVLSDETQTEFWIMKMINDSTAVKVPVKTGISAKDKIEILEPVFSKKDKILLTGQYGLADTATVKMEK